MAKDVITLRAASGQTADIVPLTVNGYGLYVQAGRAIRYESLYVLDIITDETGCGGGRTEVRIRPDGQVEYDGDFTDATRTFYNHIGQMVAWTQSQELAQLREEVAALRAERNG